MLRHTELVSIENCDMRFVAECTQRFAEAHQDRAPLPKHQIWNVFEQDGLGHKILDDPDETVPELCARVVRRADAIPH